MFGINYKTNLAGLSSLAVTIWQVVQAALASGIWYSGINEGSIVGIIAGVGLLLAKDRDVTGGTKVQSSEGAKEVVK